MIRLMEIEEETFMAPEIFFFFFLKFSFQLT